MLSETGIASHICGDVPGLVVRLEQGAGFALITEEAVASRDLRPLRSWLDVQPEWSDFPFVLLTFREGILDSRMPELAVRFSWDDSSGC